MANDSSPRSAKRAEHFADMLREQGVSPEEQAELLPVLHRLSEWQAPQPEPTATQSLLAVLATQLAPGSPVRQAIELHRQKRLALLLETAQVQVSLFGLGFWLTSALITLFGAAAVLGRMLPDQAMLLRISGPLLAYLGTIGAFRGQRRRVLELELVCLPSPLELTIARLMIVLGYDVVLSLVLSLLLWAGGSGELLTLTLSWFMPLLLVAGLALLLSLRLSIKDAASLAYGSWLVFLALSTVSNLQALLLAPGLLVLAGCIGLVGLTIALLRIHAQLHRLLPHS